MKHVMKILIVLVIFTFTSLNALAVTNRLHTITLDKGNDTYNIILNADTVTKVNKKAISKDELVLDIPGVEADGNTNALYKGSNAIDSLVIENNNNKIRIHIKADNIKNSTVLIDPVNGSPTIVGETLPIDKLLCTLFVLTIFSLIFRVARKCGEEDDKILIKKDIKEREIQMYRKYCRELNSTNPIINRKISTKIDRKIDDRLTI